MKKPCSPNNVRQYAEGGKIDADELMRQMTAKYGAPAAGQANQPPVQQAPRPQPQAPAPQQPQGIIGLLKNRGAQIDRAAGYADGGKIKGPGTPTSDDIDAEVQETGEPIKVSTGERIVSHAQGKLLEQIAKGIGYKSLDDLLEAGTGRPVGPTVKGGRRAAEGGMSPEEREYRLKSGNIAGPDFRGLASAATSFLPDESPLKQWANSGSKPAAPTSAANAAETPATPVSMQSQPVASAFDAPKPAGISAIANQPSDASFMTGKAKFDESGKQIGMDNPDSSGGGFFKDNRAYTVQPTKQEGISKVVSNGVSPLYTNIKPEDAVSGLKNQMIGGDAAAVQEGLARHARANAITQSMIDQQPMGGVAVLADPNAADNAEKTARWRQDDLIAKSRHNPAAGAVAQQLAHNQGNLAQAELSNQAAMRGQDVHAASEAERNKVAMRGQDMTSKNEQARISGNPLDQQAKQIEIDRAKRLSDLQEKAIGGDAAALKALNTLTGKNQDKYVALHAAGGTDPSDPMGLRKLPDQVVVVNERTGERIDRAAGQQMTPQQEYQSALQRANGDKAKIEQINRIAKANGVIQ